jgi:glycosyltransferase involved in cell wall biosynthesis
MTRTEPIASDRHFNHGVLFIVHYPAFAGPHNRILRIAEPLREADWDCAVVLPSEPGNAAKRLASSGVQVISAPLDRLRKSINPIPNLQLIGRSGPQVANLRSIIRAWDPDVVVIGNLLMPHGAIAAKLENRPVIWQIVDTSIPLPLQILVMPLVRLLADVVVFGGARLIESHLGARRLPQPCLVVPPPVDTERFVPDPTARASVRHELGIGDSKKVVGQVININPKKGLEYFLRAARLILDQEPDTRFLIIGAAHAVHHGYYEEILRLQRDLKITDDQMLWLGDKADTERYFAAMDVFVVSSVPNSEGTTTTSMEALSCQIPVVATNVGAVSDVVVDHETGLLVEPNRPDALAGAILSLLRDDTRRDELGEAGRDRTKQLFGLDVCVSRYLQVFATAYRHHNSGDNLGSFGGSG